MKKILIHIGLMIVAAFVIGWLAMVWLNKWTRHGDTIAVPTVKSLAYDRAVSLLDSEGLKGIVSDSVFDNSTKPGTVIEQNPKAGTIVKEGREVFLTINAFSPKMVTLPTLTDISVRQARSIIEGLDIHNIVERRVPSDFKDLVLGVRYKGVRVMPGARVPVNATLELEVGEGAPELMPDSIDDETEKIDLF
ncbi:MAG: PASTA domain-containing protein [Duncaniella sp.]|nr:PASTA domain-containing protein [Duncaniella sp.]